MLQFNAGKISYGNMAPVAVIFGAGRYPAVCMTLGIGLRPLLPFNSAAMRDASLSYTLQQTLVNTQASTTLDRVLEVIIE